MRGFTLIELVLVLALISLVSLAGIGLRDQLSGALESVGAVETAQNALRYAHAAARAQYGDAAWSVRFVPGSVTAFRGSVWDARDTSFDRLFSLDPAPVLVATAQVTFEKMTGFVGVPAEISLQSERWATRLVIDQYGMITRHE